MARLVNDSVPDSAAGIAESITAGGGRLVVVNSGNPYAILGVPEGASGEEIKKAHRRQMRLAAVDIHPDVSDAEREVLQQRMVEVNWAFEALSGPRREAVDAELRRQRAAEAVREQQLKQEQDRRQAAWESAQRRAREARDHEREVRAWQEAVLEQEHLQRVRRQAQEHAPHGTTATRRRASLPEGSVGAGVRRRANRDSP